MTGFFLMHMNVVRPIGPYSKDTPHLKFFFDTLQNLLPVASQHDGMKFHTHGARYPDGSFTQSIADMIDFDTGSTEENPTIITMAGWRDLAAFKAFAYREKLHAKGMKGLRDWVDRSQGETMVMWWLPKGAKTSIEQGWDRLIQLREKGAGPDAFTLKQFFDAPGCDTPAAPS